LAGARRKRCGATEDLHNGDERRAGSQNDDVDRTPLPRDGVILGGERGETLRAQTRPAESGSRGCTAREERRTTETLELPIWWGRGG